MAEEKEKKEKNKIGLFSTIRSVGEPELRKFAEGIADAIPEDSIFRSETAERVIGYLKTWVENKAKSTPGLKGDLMETATDLIDFSGLFSKKRGGEKVAKVVKDWMDQFFTESGKRLREAKTIPEKEAELQMIKREFELRQELLSMIEAAKPKPESEKEKKPLISDEVKKEVKETVEKIRDKHADWMKKRIQTLKERKW
ncbi:hypothetical protein EPN15_04480 [Patescibacteria group bacterium]|nr:MAG: hypothetical protein EPN15_04480 [Patescibacteria group bacterium]